MGSKKIKLFGALFLFVISIGISLAPAVQPKAQARDVSLSDACVPVYTAGTDSSHHQEAGWMTFRWVDRATIIATYNAKGKCANNGNDPIYFAKDVKFNDIFSKISDNGKSELYFYDNNTGDANFDYRAKSGGGSQDDSRVFRFGQFVSSDGQKLENVVNDSLSGKDRIIGSSQFDTAAKGAQIVLSLEEGATTLNCPDVQSGNFILQDNSKSPSWVCSDSGDASGFQGYQINVNDFTSKDNFNITYIVEPGGAKISHVSEGEQGTRTFTWCPDQNSYTNNDCDGDLTFYDLSGNVLTQDAVGKLGKVVSTFQICNKSKTCEKVEVAGAETQQTKDAIQVATDTGTGGIINAQGGTACVANTSTTCGKDECSDAPFELSWFICPILKGADATVNALNGLIEGLLVFKTSGGGNDLAITSGGDNSSPIHRTWALIKNLATSLLVIIMLVAIFSEAVGYGPFDAYSVRKVLPKIIIAIIAIQLSWPFLKYTIDIFNDLGTGLADLLFAPFGGNKGMTLAALMSTANLSFASQAGGFGVFAAGIVIALKIAAGKGFIFGIALLALPIITAVIVGFFVLVLRKMLIILLLMLAPLAIVAWLLPGTQKYWKFWHETFFGLLMMFPVLAVIIASGRIFAYVTAVGGGSAGGLLQFMVIIVCVFMPYFLLPKVFQWSSKLLGNLTGMINNKNKGALDRSRGFLQTRQKETKVRKTAEAGDNLRRLRAGERMTDVYSGGRIQQRIRHLGNRITTGTIDPTREWADPLEAEKHRVQVENAQTRRTAEERSLRAKEGKDLQDLAQLEALGLNASTPDGLTGLRAMLDSGDENRVIAASMRLMQAKQFGELESRIDHGLAEEAAGRNSAFLDAYREAWNRNPSLYGDTGAARTDLRPDQLGRDMASVARTRSIPDAGVLDASFIQRAAYGTNPDGTTRSRAAAPPPTSPPTSPVVQAAHQAIMEQMQGMAMSDTSAQQMLGGAKEEAYTYVLESQGQIGGTTGVNNLQEWITQQQQSRIPTPTPPPLHPDPARAAVIGETDFDTHQRINAARGIHNMTDDEVIHIYDHKQDPALKSAAENDLRRRGLIR